VRVAVVIPQFSEKSSFKSFVKFNKNSVTLTVLIVDGLVNSFIRRFRLQLVNTLYSPLSQQTSVTVTPLLPLLCIAFQASNGERFPSSGLPNCPRASAAFHSLQITTAQPTLAQDLLDWLASNQSQSHVTTDGQSASVFRVSGTHLGPMTRFLLMLDCCWFVDVGRPLW
jgi:hypothetical protein